MAKAHINKVAANTFVSDGFPNGAQYVGDYAQHTNNGVSSSFDWPSRSDIIISEGSHVRIEDLVMTSNEFKVCMQMLLKTAMKEMPEEFI